MAGRSKEAIQAALEARKKAFLEDSKKLKARLNAIESKERRAADRKRNHILILIGAGLLKSESRDRLIAEAVAHLSAKDAEKVKEFTRGLPPVAAATKGQQK